MDIYSNYYFNAFVAGGAFVAGIIFNKAARPIGRTIKHGYYRSKEILVNLVLSEEGKDVSFEHYTSKDYNNYKRWVLDFKGDIFEFLASSTLPGYMALKESDKLYPTCADFVKRDKSYLDKHIDKDYRNDALLIESYISDYVKSVDEPPVCTVKEKQWWSSIYHSDRKMSPQKMIVTLVGNFVENTLVNFSDKEHELKKIKVLRQYLAKIRQDDAVSRDRNFSIFVNSTYNKIVDIEKNMEKKLNIDEFKNNLTKAYNSSKSVAHDFLRLFCSLFNFNTKRTSVIDNVSEHVRKDKDRKTNIWLSDICSHLDSDISEYDFKPESFIARLESIIQNELSSEDYSTLLRFQHPCLSKDDYKSLAKIQRNILEIANLLKIIEYYKNSNSNSSTNLYKLRLPEVKYVISSLYEKITDTLTEIKDIQNIYDNLKIYIADNKPEDHGASAQIINLIDSLKTALFSSATHIKESISSLYCTEVYEQDGSSAISQLIKLIGNQEQLFNFSQSILDKKIIEFINSLRTDNTFETKIIDIVTKYFEIESFDNGTVSVTAIKDIYKPVATNGEKKIDTYYLLLLQIFSELLIAFDDYESASAVITKFSEFFLKNFIRGSDKNASTMFKFFSSELIRKSKDARENIQLRQIIEEHLASFEKHLVDFIQESSESIGIDYSSTLPTANKLNRFVPLLLEIIKNNSEKSKKLIIEYNQKVALSPEEPSLRKELTKQLNDHLTESLKINKIVLKSLEHINNVLNATMALKDRYEEIVKKSDDIDNLPLLSISKSSLDDISRQIRASIKIHSATINQLNSTIDGIAEHNNTSLSLIVKDIMRNIQIYKRNISQKGECQLYFANILRCFGARNLCLELALIKYIEKIITSNSDALIFKLVSIFKYISTSCLQGAQRVILSKEFVDFVNRTLALISNYYTYDDNWRLDLELDSIVFRSNSAVVFALPGRNKGKLHLTTDSIVDCIDRINFTRYSRPGICGGEVNE